MSTPLSREDALYRAKSVLEALNAAFNGSEGDRIAEPTYCLDVALDLIGQALAEDGRPA